MDAKTRSILKDARHTILWLCNPQLRELGESKMPRPDIVQAIDELLYPPGSDAAEPVRDHPKCPQCGEEATYQTPDGTFWDSSAHYWRDE